MVKLFGATSGYNPEGKRKPTRAECRYIKGENLMLRKSNDQLRDYLARAQAHIAWLETEATILRSYLEDADPLSESHSDER